MIVWWVYCCYSNMAITMAASGHAVMGFLIPLIMMIVVSFGEDRAIYLVLMEGDPVAFHQQGSMPFQEGQRRDPNSIASKRHAKHLEESHDQLLERSLKVGSYSKIYSYKHIVNGFSVHTTPSQVKVLELAEGVKLVERDRGAKLMTTYSPKYLGLPTGVWSQGGDRNAGEGLVIGIIDTGIDPMHPSFAYDPTSAYRWNESNSYFSGGVCEEGPRFPRGSCNGKIVSAKYFSAGAQALQPLDPSIDYLSPFDAVGHGSHVASTAAGNSEIPVVTKGFFYGQASGMAPAARIAVYKAIFPSVGTTSDVVAAIDQAVTDGVDILTLSVGPDEPPEDTITFFNVFDIFMLFARRAGVFVVQAAGNQGPAPSTVVSFSPWAMGVAACSTDRYYPATLLLGNGQRISGVGLSGPSLGNGFLHFKLVLAKDAVKLNGSFPRTPPYVEECQFTEALNPSVVLGSIVICSFSAGFANQTSTVTAIVDTATRLGFAGFVLVSNPAYGEFIADPIPFSVPGIMVPKLADVQIISDYYEKQVYRNQSGLVRRFSARAAIGDGRLASFHGKAPIVSRFSSRGPDIIDDRRNLVDVLKPDILAPGHLIWAAWSPMSVFDPILMGDNFALLSGTSMATPHISGIAALIKQHNPSWTPSMLASAISTTASKYDNHGEPIMAEGAEISSLYPSTPFDIGAGLINASRALDPGLVFASGFEDYINFLCSLPNVDPATVNAMTGRSCVNPLPYPGDLNLPSITLSALNGSQTVKRTVKNVAKEQETYTCSVLQPEGVVVSISPSSFSIDPDGTYDVYIKIDVTEKMDVFSFGEVVLTGSLDHIVRVPLSVLPVSVC